MTEIFNLETKIAPRIVGYLQVVGEVANKQGHNLYLVGGVVRDLILGRSILDFDLVVEGDAIKLAQRLADITKGKIATHPRFNTAKVQWDQWSFDLATARSETYDKPGALPKVKPSSLASDLFRRDFTINTMAIELTPDRYCQLIDLHGGRDDLEHKLIRVLHERSFIDDATRIWRGLRYEQRLHFHLEPNTLKLLKRDIPMLDTISGDRIRHELELILKEEFPEKILGRAEELGVLPKLHPALKGDGWLAEKLERARQLSSPKLLLPELHTALLAYRLTNEEKEDLISRLRLTKSVAQVLRETISVKSKLETLADPGLTPSSIYHLLHGYSLTAIMASYLASDSPVVRKNIHLFLTRFRYVKPALTGNNLKKMGIAPGPQMKEILQRLHEARLDGKVTTKKGEEEMVKGWVVR